MSIAPGDVIDIVFAAVVAVTSILGRKKAAEATYRIQTALPRAMRAPFSKRFYEMMFPVAGVLCLIGLALHLMLHT